MYALVSAHQNQINIDPLNLFNEKGRSVARCPEPYDKIIAITNKTRVRDEEEKNTIFNMC